MRAVEFNIAAGLFLNQKNQLPEDPKIKTNSHLNP
jgi:hypothetical protein